MSKKTVAIEVSSACISLWLQQGPRWLLLESLEQPEGDWSENWSAAIASQSQRIAAWVASHALAGSTAFVVYSRPGTPVIVSSVPRGAPGIAISRLALAEAAHFSLTEAACSIYQLGSDRGTAAGCQDHFLAFAELHSILEAIETFTVACGLIPAGSVPSSAGLLDSAYRLWSTSDAVRPVIALEFGDQQSAIVACEAGRIRFARCLPLGLEQLATIVKRELEARGAAGTASLGPLELLRASGIPRRGSSAFGVPLDTIIPATQSVLQRLVVELKQSIRFGFTEQARTAVLLLPGGRGLAVENLFAIIAAQAGCEAVAPAPVNTAAAHGAPPRSDGPAGRTLLAHGLRSLSTSSKNTLSELRRAVLVGTALAMVYVAGDAAVARMRLAGLRQEVEKLAAPVGHSGATKAIAERTLATEAALAGLTARIRSWYGQSTRPDALMLEVASSAGSDAVFSELDVRTTSTVPTARLRGIAFGDTRRAVQRIVDKLAGSPLIAEAKLESIRRGGRDAAGREGDQFDIVLRLAAVPASAAALSSPEAGQ